VIIHFVAPSHAATAGSSTPQDQSVGDMADHAGVKGCMAPAGTLLSPYQSEVQRQQTERTGRWQ
jgi:hypothetical protein